MEKVIIYDGECNLCLNVVRFIRRHTTDGAFIFVPQQSPDGQSLIRKFLVPDRDTSSVIYITGGKYLLRSAAVLNIFRDMGGLWKLLYLFIIFPPFIRDAVYRLVARLRK